MLTDDEMAIDAKVRQFESALGRPPNRVRIDLGLATKLLRYVSERLPAAEIVVDDGTLGLRFELILNPAPTVVRQPVIYAPPHSAP